jgi:hypothetical protein
MRDLWQTTDMNYGAKFGVATYPKKLKSSGIKSLLERAIRAQCLCRPLQGRSNRREWKGAHGFRKYYKTHTEQVMRPINVEITMGHDIGISASYYKPTEREVLEDYLKAVPLLTINGDNIVLQKKVAELTEKSKDSEYIVKAKLSEKDNDILELKAAVEFLKNKVNGAIISDSSSEVISNDKGIPKAIKFSAMTGTVSGEIAK